MNTTNLEHSDYVWLIYLENLGSMVKVTLTYERILPDGSSITFDADPAMILDTATEQDEQIVLDGFMALVPPDALLSCAMRTTRWMLLWTKPDIEHIFAEYDHAIVRREFGDGRLYNAQGNIDALFIGGDRAAHQTSTIKHWATTIEKQVLPMSGQEQIQAWDAVLAVYQAVIYTQTTEIHLLTRNTGDALNQARAALSAVAARYGLRLPAPDLQGVQR